MKFNIIAKQVSWLTTTVEAKNEAEARKIFDERAYDGQYDGDWSESDVEIDEIESV